jgi:hypothetical protein
MALCFYVNDEGRCHCGIATLAQDTDLSETTVRSRLRWLDDIGAIVRVPQWLDEHGRRSYDHHGRDGRENHRKRTSDEISLALDEDGEAIEERARGKENPARVVSSEEDAPFDPSPHTGLDGDNETVSPMPALCQPCDSAQVLDSSELEQEDSPPTPPPLGGRSKIVSDEKRASFERFSKTYPSPIVDYEATLRLWASLSDEDTEDAIKGARGYARFLADLTAQGRPPLAETSPMDRFFDDGGCEAG